jgi:hypothetical protein
LGTVNSALWVGGHVVALSGDMTMTTATATIPQLITPGVIAKELNVPLHAVTHILATRGHIGPSARAGTLRLYDRVAIEQVRQELEEISKRRRRPGPA